MIVSQRAPQGRPREMADEAEILADALLKNWAVWARGTVRLDSGPPVQPRGFEPIEDDARRCEEILLQLRQRRENLYRVARFTYLLRYGDDTAARSMSRRRARPMSRWQYASMIRALWIYVSAAYLEMKIRR